MTEMTDFSGDNLEGGGGKINKSTNNFSCKQKMPCFPSIFRGTWHYVEDVSKWQIILLFEETVYPKLILWIK